MYFILKNHVTKCPINSKRKNEMDIIYIYIYKWIVRYHLCVEKGTFL